MEYSRDIIIARYANPTMYNDSVSSFKWFRVAESSHDYVGEILSKVEDHVKNEHQNNVLESQKQYNGRRKKSLESDKEALIMHLEQEHSQ